MVSDGAENVAICRTEVLTGIAFNVSCSVFVGVDIYRFPAPWAWL